MAIEKATIKCESIFSDDSGHRYLMSKVWDKTLPQANVITISPSADYNISTDLTTNLIINNLYLLGFGGFTLTNLISKIGVDVKKIKHTDNLWNDETDKYILDAAEKAHSIILAWGQFTKIRKIFEDREEAVMNMIKTYCEKTFQISDSNDRGFLHPLTPSVRTGWNLKKI